MEKHLQLVRKIRILCSSGLPLYPLVTGLFREIGQYIPFSANALFLDTARPTCGIFLSQDMTHWALPFMTSGPFRRPRRESSLSGNSAGATKPSSLPLPNFFPDFPNSEAYQEFYRLLGIHHATALLLKGAGFQAIFTIARRMDMKPFSNEELRLLERLAPIIRHGMSIAFETNSRTMPETPPETWNDLVPLKNPGLLLLSPEGHVLSMDERASELLVQRALIEKVFRPEDDEAMRKAFKHLARSVSKSFDPKTDPGREPQPASEVLLSHDSGLIISLKGFRLHGEANAGHVGIHVRHIVRRTWLCIKLKARFALSPREIQILERFAIGQDSKSILYDLKIARETLNTYVSRLLEKTGSSDIETLGKETSAFLSGSV